VVEALLPVGNGALTDELELMPPETVDPIGPTMPLETDVELSGYIGVDEGAPVDRIMLPEKPEDKGAVPRMVELARAVEFVYEGAEALELETPPETLPLADIPVLVVRG